MNSCLYDCKIVHTRVRPRPHKLSHASFMFCLDLNELAELPEKFSYLSSIYKFVDSDYLPGVKGSLIDRVRYYVGQLGGESSSVAPEQIKRVLLLTNLRCFGYIFNPLSVFFCFDRTDSPLCALVEVGNTFHEKKPYLLHADFDCSPGDKSELNFSGRHRKHFYVSPFSPLQQIFQFNFKMSRETLSACINTEDDEGVVVAAVLDAERVELSKSKLLSMTLRFPFVTLRTIADIHFQALLLFLKGTPFFLKEQNENLQTGIISDNNLRRNSIQLRREKYL